MKRALLVGGVLGALTFASNLPAQTTVGWDVGAYSSYVWRGVTYTNKPVLQPDLYLSFPVGTGSFTAGGWANIEIGQYNGATDISESGGSSAFNLAEFDWWGEFSLPAGKATVTAGATGYIFPNDFGLTKDFNTVEIYGKVSLDSPLSPRIAAYYDVDKINGLYVEGGISHSVPLGPKSLNLGALAGISAGQNATLTEAGNFADNGLVHMDFSASLPLEAGALSITPVAHVLWCNDDWTKFTSAGKTHDLKFWAGVTISWSRALGGKAAEE